MDSSSSEPGLPAPLSAFIGRDRELEELRELIREHRLVTIVGAGGCGKSRLALEVARRIQQGRDRVVRWVELAPLQRPELLTQHAAAQLQVLERPDRTILESLFAALQSVRLLVFDNCEHLIEESAQFISALLKACPALHVLATSREPLCVGGERRWLLNGLAVHQQTQARDHGCEAVRLFVDRASSVTSGFRLTETNADSIEGICRRLEGMPLAIELAAARTATLAVDQIAVRLDDALGLLTSGSRSAPPHHRTLRATVDWSFRLISAHEQDLLVRLSVFSGQFSLDAAEHVCGSSGQDGDSLLDLISGLVARSLVRMHEEGGTARFSILEIIRQYAAQIAARDPDGYSVLQSRHAGYYATLAIETQPALERHQSPEIAATVALEYDNFRAALSWAFAGGDRTIGHRLAGALWRYWGQTWQLAEAEHWWSLALDGSDSSSRDWGQVLNGAGTFMYVNGNSERALELLGRAAEVLGSSGDHAHQAMALSTAAHVLCTSGRSKAALPLAEKAVAIARPLEEAWPLCNALSNGLGLVHMNLGRLDLAEACLQEALQEARRRAPNPWALATVARACAALALTRGRVELARELTLEAIDAAQHLLDPHLSMRILVLAQRLLTLLGLHAAAAHAAGSIVAARRRGMLVLAEDLRAYEELENALRQKLHPLELESCLAQGQECSVAQGLLRAREHIAGTDHEQRRPGDEALPGVPAGPHDLEIRVLGCLEVLLPSFAHSILTPGQHRCVELLTYLLLHRGGQSREQIGLAFWPDASTVQVKNNFHVHLYKLRKMLGRNDFIIAAGQTYKVNPAISIWFDAELFEREITAALRCPDAEQTTARLKGALHLYRGAFLDLPSAGEWSVEHRNRLQLLRFRGLSALADLQIGNGLLNEAIATLEQLIQADELHEEPWRRLMNCLQRNGQGDQALLLYRQLARRLRDEIGVEPEPATRALARRLAESASD